MTIFVEYEVKSSQRTNYLKLIGKVKQKHPSLQVYEGTDQPGLFLEIWGDMDEAQYEKWRENRFASSLALWASIHACIEGGVSKVREWRFTQHI